MSAAESEWHGITDDTLAQWALGKLAAYTTERDRIRRNAQAEVERIQAKALADEKPITDKIDWLTGELTGFMRTIRKANPKVKTYKLPGGDLISRAGSKSTKVTDEAAFITWALKNAQAAIKMTPLVSVLDPSHGFTKTKTGAITAAGGEIVPGVEIVTADDTYSVSLTTGDDA